MINLRHILNPFTIQHTEWTPEDTDALQLLLSHPGAGALIKLLHKRINDRTEDLVNGKETRDRIDEVKDIIIELETYANT